VLESARANVSASGASVMLWRWDARSLPFRRASVDRIVSTLPFGRRVGSHISNRHLYPRFLNEVYRVLRPGGKAVLLTLERRMMFRLLGRHPNLHLTREVRVNIGGMLPTLYVIEKSPASADSDKVPQIA